MRIFYSSISRMQPHGLIPHQILSSSHPKLHRVCSGGLLMGRQQRWTVAAVQQFNAEEEPCRGLSRSIVSMMSFVVQRYFLYLY